MTAHEMNGRSAKKMTGRFVAALAPVLAGPVLLTLAACAGAFEADGGGAPLQGRVQTLVEDNRRFPAWADFPRASAETPGVEAIAARVEALTSSNRALSGQVGRLVWTLDDPVVFEAQARQRLAAVPPSPEAARTLEQLEAWAEAQRRRAAPPPPIPNRP